MEKGRDESRALLGAKDFDMMRDVESSMEYRASVVMACSIVTGRDIWGSDAKT